MSNESEKTFRWSVRDPRGKIISLTEETFKEHIKNDHKPKDAQMRESVEENVKESIENPDFILTDKEHPGTRENYIKFDIINVGQGKYAGKIIQTVAEDEFVVTWMARNTLTRHFTDDEIIYRK